MDAWVYVVIFASIVLLALGYGARERIRLAFATLSLRRTLKKCGGVLYDYAFEAEGELHYIPYVIVNQEGVLALFSYPFHGRIRGLGGNVYWSNITGINRERLLNPEHIAVYATQALRQKLGGTPVSAAIIFPVGDIKDAKSFRVITPDYLKTYARNQSADNALMAQLSAVKLARRQTGKAKRQASAFIRMRCPQCGKRLRLCQNERRFIGCTQCDFTRRYSFWS